MSTTRQTLAQAASSGAGRSAGGASPTFTSLLVNGEKLEQIFQSVIFIEVSETDALTLRIEDAALITYNAVATGKT